MGEKGLSFKICQNGEYIKLNLKLRKTKFQIVLQMEG